MLPYSPTCPEPVTHAVSTQDWLSLTFLHWPVEPDALRPLLPPALEPDTCRGSGWVGLVPFGMRIHCGPFPPIPYLTTFPETNVRTYVRGPDGRPGVWFLSLDVPRLAFVLLTRATYRVPYMWSQMQVEVKGNHVKYRSHRRWPRPEAASTIDIEIGDVIPPPEIDDLDHFLIARWGLYAWVGGRLAYTPIEHGPWPLAHARLLRCEDTLVLAAGITGPHDHTPLVRFSPGTRARIGLPRTVPI